MLDKERLKEVRHKAGRSLTDVAGELGKSRATIGHWETGKAQPCSDTLARLCRYLGVSADYLLGLSDRRGRR